MTASTHTHDYDTIHANPGLLDDDVSAEEAHRYFEDITATVNDELDDREFSQYTIDIDTSYVGWKDEEGNRFSTENRWEVSNYEDLGYEPSIGRHTIVAEDTDTRETVEVSATYYGSTERLEVEVSGEDVSTTVDVGEALEGTLDDSLFGWI